RHTHPFRGTYIEYTSFTAWTTGVSNPVRYPCFRASASVAIQGAAFASGIPPHLYAFHHYTRNSTPLYRTLVRQYQTTSPGLAMGLSCLTYPTACAPFTPSNSG